MKVLTNEFSTRSVYPMFAWDFEVAVKFAKEELEGFKEELLRPPTKQRTSNTLTM